MASTTTWESWPARDRRHSFRARVAPPLKAELFTVSAHLAVDVVDLSEAGCLVTWNVQELGPLADEGCDLIVHVPSSSKRFPPIPCTVRHRERRGDVFCAGLELHFKPKIVFAAIARELRRVWVDAQRRAIQNARGK